MTRAAARSRRLPRPVAWLILLGSVALIGCSLIPTFDRTELEARHLNLPGVPPGKDAIQLELVFVERAPDDPLIGPALWRDVDQLGSLPAETRKTLQDHGIRVGHIGSTPPQSIQTLLGMVPEITDAEAENLLQGRRLMVQSGKETEVEASPLIQNCQLSFPADSGEPERTFENACCKFRLKVVRLQDGWVRVDFLPEIHHGAALIRPEASNKGWTLKGGQEILPRPGQKFSLTLGVGEYALVTAEPGCENSLGDWFFRPREGASRRQRLLLVRIAGMAQTESIYQPASGSRAARVKPDPVELRAR